MQPKNIYCHLSNTFSGWSTKQNRFKVTTSCLQKIVRFDFPVGCKFYIELIHLKSGF